MMGEDTFARLDPESVQRDNTIAAKPVKNTAISTQPTLQIKAIEIVSWWTNLYRTAARVLAWLGIAAIVILSVVPAVDRPVTGVGQLSEHFVAFSLVAGIFAIGYRFSLVRHMLLALIFCGAVELLQVPLPTRHARLSDFIIDLAGACFGIWFANVGVSFVQYISQPRKEPNVATSSADAGQRERVKPTNVD
jgi:hypothetical protein